MWSRCLIYSVRYHSSRPRVPLTEHCRGVSIMRCLRLLLDFLACQTDMERGHVQSPRASER